jgi:hypothetical protein
VALLARTMDRSRPGEVGEASETLVEALP